MREVVDEVLLTLSPTLARRPIAIRVDVPEKMMTWKAPKAEKVESQ